MDVGRNNRGQGGNSGTEGEEDEKGIGEGEMGGRDRMVVRAPRWISCISACFAHYHATPSLPFLLLLVGVSVRLGPAT